MLAFIISDHFQAESDWASMQEKRWGEVVVDEDQEGSGKYTGECMKGFAHGEGTIKFNSGNEVKAFGYYGSRLGRYLYLHKYTHLVTLEPKRHQILQNPTLYFRMFSILEVVFGRGLFEAKSGAQSLTHVIGTCNTITSSTVTPSATG